MDHTPHRLSRRTLAGAAALGLAAVLLTGCSTAAGAPAAPDNTPHVTIGYFPNVTHAPGLIADGDGLFAQRFAGTGFTVATKSFNAGPDVIQAILSGSLDISYIGPNPTVTAYIQSHGDGIRVIAGSTSGGAALVVKAGVTSVGQLKGTKIATPQLGNTQDVALRYFLKSKGLTATTDGGGDVSILPQANSAAVQAFATGTIDGAWVPEPFATQLVAKGGHVLVDERTLWPKGTFVTTDVIARTDFVTQHPDLVAAFLRAHLDALDEIAKDPAKAQATVAAQIKRITNQDLDPAVLAKAWKNLTFTADPLASALKASADHAAEVGLLPNRPSDGFAKLWDVTVLNQELSARGRPKVQA